MYLAGEVSECAEEVSVVVYVSQNEGKRSHWFCSFRLVARNPAHHVAGCTGFLHENCDTAQGGCYQYTRFRRGCVPASTHFDGRK